MLKLIFILAALLIAAPAPAQTAGVQLTWQDNSDNEEGFRVERQLNGGVFEPLLVTIGANVTALTDFTVVAPTTPGAPDQVYCYRAMAFNAAGASPYTNTACHTFAAPKLQPPAAPSNLEAAAITSSSLQLRWRDNATGETSQEIRVTQATPPAAWTVPVPANATSFKITGLKKNTLHRAAVRAVGDGGVSAYSNEIAATTSKR